MATITLTIPDDQVARVVAAMKEHDGRNPADGLPQGVTQAAFVRRVLADWVRARVRQYELSQAVQVAGDSVTDIDAS